VRARRDVVLELPIPKAGDGPGDAWASSDAENGSVWIAASSAELHRRPKSEMVDGVGCRPRAGAG